MATRADRFDAALREAKKAGKFRSLRDLSAKIPMAHQHLSLWKQGGIASTAHLPTIARELDVDPAWLDTGEGPPPPWASAPSLFPPAITVSEPGEMPVIGSAGAADNGQRGVIYDHPESLALSPDIAAVDVRGNSAYPVAYDGQRVLINLKRPLHDNNLAVVVLADGDAVLVKRWCPQKDGTHVVLASPDGGLNSIAVHRSEVRNAWPVVGVLFEG